VESIHHFRLRETVCGLSSKLSERPFRISALQAVLTMTRLGRQSLLTSAFLFYACLFLEGVVCKDDELVTCGSVIKISHVDTGYYLNSEPKNLNSGSGQQLVTFVADPGTQNTLWWLRPAHHGGPSEYTDKGDAASCQLAQPVPCGSMFRLTHTDTLKNLHSHGVKSVLSQQQEVSAYGKGDGNGDGGDNWMVECAGHYWKRDEAVRFFHIDTQKYLGTASNVEFNESTCGRQCPIMGHLEAFGRASTDKYTTLKVEQGIHLSM
jgi:dolichyl-phosphate-mannose--protein O-mannosyl transferase